MKALSGAIVVLSGAIIFASASFGDRFMNHPGVAIGVAVSIIGFIIMGIAWRSTGD